VTATTRLPAEKLGGPTSTVGTVPATTCPDDIRPVGHGAATSCRPWPLLAIYRDGPAPPVAHAGGAAAEYDTGEAAAPRASVARGGQPDPSKSAQLETRTP